MSDHVARSSCSPEPDLDCPLCPRLVEFRNENARAHPDWFNAPAPSFGDPSARLLIVGLAPGLQGANRTGRPFTGDYAGDLLYATLAKFGFSRGTYDARPDDGLRLVDAMITNAVRCVPPQNKPTGDEIRTCMPFLQDRIAALPKLRAIVCLGKIAHDATARSLGQRLKDMPFGHGGTHAVTGMTGARYHIFDSYHCSRYNTNTGRLTTAMFEDVFKKVATLLDVS